MESYYSLVRSGLVSELTFFLAVIAFALFVLIIFVSFVFPKKQSLALLKQSVAETTPEWQEASFFPGQFAGLPEERFPVLEARLNALNNKVLLAHERLQKIEELLQNSANKKKQLLLAAPSEEFTALNKRVERLMNFKSSAEIELAVIKDALREKGILKPLEKNPRMSELQKKTRNAESDLSNAEKKLHDLIYHAASSK